jgi:hypothetical protein
MELEERVKTLEYEIKILKNEIQRALLDIQEQVLVHYYPDLRADDDVTPEAMKGAVAAIRAKQPGPGADPPPATKKVTLEQARAMQSDASLAQAAAPGTSPAPTPRAPASVSSTDQPTMVKLTEWVNGSATKIGGDRLVELIKGCADRGVITAETQTLLLRFASMFKDRFVEKVAVNEVLAVLLKFYEVLGRTVDMDEVLSVIEEAKLG